MNTAYILDAQYWNNRYTTADTGWDMRQVSPPLQAYIDQLANKALRILIPGCGNSYEAMYLLQQGFTNITVMDIAIEPVKLLQEKCNGMAGIKIIHGDFFEHTGAYDLILEQTFFCAIDPKLRSIYVQQMHALLAPGGKLVGVLFNTMFEKAGPPFGGSITEYKQLFNYYFSLAVMTNCYNSYSKRAGTEVFINLSRKEKPKDAISMPL
jgi:methyl halide transferase